MCYGEVYYIYLDNRLWFIHIQKTIRTLYFGVKFREAILYPKHNVELQKYIRGLEKRIVPCKLSNSFRCLVLGLFFVFPLYEHKIPLRFIVRKQ